MGGGGGGDGQCTRTGGKTTGGYCILGNCQPVAYNAWLNIMCMWCEGVVLVVKGTDVMAHIKT